MPEGRGETVVLVHGLGSSFRHNWETTGWVDVLRGEGHEVVGVQLPGHGASGPSGVGADEPDAADRILRVAASFDAVSAVGFSAGAVAVLRAAARRPGSFRRLAVLGIGDRVLRPSTAEATTRLADMIDAREEPDDVHGRLFRRMAATAGNDPAAVAAYLRAAPGAVPPAEVERITAPTLVVVGDRDPAAPADRLAAVLPDSQSVVLRGVDHFATTGDIRCLDAVVTFLAA
ncbi:alpha/beta fold hydrolase [Pseudonocardia kunmingensis]|uniref:Alpha-beta hydrolase superfamily lysophospholipase n=1 Tax=Pseudonocardia kunmingensis TaxID=630975 RepID=A0A543DPA7_9PSEU|nr:alpha/beta hydrolase [Pseudonocardia kunmingensis]TQM11176.1 alpha-beta hydrolase superfamily lysophospholipase [Pseudonocardia kunmingensis]